MTSATPDIDPTSPPTWPQVRAAFQRIWGYPDFRPPQDAIVRSLLAGQDTLVVMPTGGGKSICFQLPALLQQGLTLVISPLVALMENQVQELRERNLPAATLHSDRPTHERRRVLQHLPRLRLLYLSPETLFTPKVWERLCQPDITLNGLILDEAHCLVQWGETFRPAYRRLGTVRPALQAATGASFAIAAFTATADPVAQATIAQVLGLKSPETVALSPYRPNLHLRVAQVWTPQARRSRLRQFIDAHRGQTGLVYVRTRRDAEQVSSWLSSRHRVAAYHAGLGSQQRRHIEADWTGNRLQFVVCTSAFGMGVNKPDCRWVAHLHAPLLLSEYVQEVGRAGRDGKRAEALTLVSDRFGWLDPQDKQRRQFFLRRMAAQRREALALASKLPKRGDLRQVAQEFKQGAVALSLLHAMGRLRWQDPFHYIMMAGAESSTTDMGTAAGQMQRYLYGRGCRWQGILTGFGFGEEAVRCGHCDRCQQNAQ
ncbi:MAG: RecQ family ATP-dependent DNA helicase [Cyanobacteria bacterium P01_A01_bin.135]